MIVAGFIVLAASWKVLYAAQKDDRLATTRPYSFLRHPQYVGLFLIVLGFLLQWPTLLTLIMFPVLVVMYVRLARQEERAMAVRFGNEWNRYASRTPAFFPMVFSARRGAVH